MPKRKNFQCLKASLDQVKFKFDLFQQFKVMSEVSLVDIAQINKRLDQIEVDQIKQDKIFKENQCDA